ncbi:TadG [Vibrio sp. S4M6]|uniref:TadE/TadG family type IV pilus assembly protein n=1 Tax=Vibrio sinus TaxID=2946865 RepID=UPI00202A5B11|nr:TadG [Vibrio sinus]MCL9783345.1 TadG [Vibrio sinus]
MDNFRKKQQGNASIIFILMLAGMIGLFPLATDSAHALQTRALLDDASEVASIAIAALNDPNKGSSSGSQTNRAIVENYAYAYVPGADIQSVAVSRKDCEMKNVICLAHFQGGYQYQVNVSMTQQSWFNGNGSMPSFGDSYTVRSQAISQKLKTVPVDVVIAADFSGSMRDTWSGGTVAKYKSLIDIIHQVTSQLEVGNQQAVGSSPSTIGLTAYNFFNHSIPRDLSSGGACRMTQEHVYTKGWFRKKYIDVYQTIREIFVPKNHSHCDTKTIDNSIFYDISLTTDFEAFNRALSHFYPDHGTASFQGIIRGAQLLNEGNNPRRLMIIVSDGVDSPAKASGYAETASQKSAVLVDAGMCDMIRNTLDSQIAYNGNSVETTLAFIGFDYDPFTNATLQKCVGLENVYQAQDSQQMINQILALINEETGHLR